MLFRTALLIAATVLLGSCVTTAKQQYFEDGYRQLSGNEIRDLHRDKTFELKLASGKTAVNYFSADGRSIFRRSDGIADLGTWEIRDDHVCYVYPGEASTAVNCHSMAEKQGHYVFFKEFYDKKGQFGAEVISITPGNAQNLPLE